MVTDFQTAVIGSISSNAGWFANMEGPVDAQTVELLERGLAVKLPEQFCAFLTNYGCGYVGKINLFSARPESEWYLPLRNARTLPASFLAISEDEAGGFYGFSRVGPECGPEVLYLYPDEADGSKSIAPTFNDYIIQMALP